MMNKQELITAINGLPIYEVKDVFVKDSEIDVNGNDMFVDDKRLKAITEKGKNEIIDVVSKWYKLVQMGEVYTPMVNYFQDVDGNIKHYWGAGVLTLFPKGEDYRIDENNRIGLVIKNSVDRSLAVAIDFCVMHNETMVMLPKKMKGIKKKHLGEVKEVIGKVEKLIGDVKEIWITIMDKFQRKLTQNDVDNILANLDLGKKFTERMKKDYEVAGHLRLFDFFMDAVEMVSDRKYKKEEMKTKKLKEIAEVMYRYAILEKL